MNSKQRFIILSLCIVLICCAGTVCAADSNNTVDIVSDADSNEEFMSVSNDKQVDDVDESVLSTQNENNNWTVNVGKLSADNDLLSDDFDDDNFDDDDDPDDGQYNYIDNNDYTIVDKNKVYFYNRIHSGDSLYFEFLTHLVDKSGFTLDLTNSDVNNQIYQLVASKDYSFKLYDGKDFKLKKGESYTAAFNNRYDYNIYGSTFKDVVYVKDNVNYLDEDYLSWLHWDKKIGNAPTDTLNNVVISNNIGDSSNLPKYYNLMDEGYVSSFKKQIGNDCWAFAAIAALESHLMKTGDSYNPFSSDFDFSENHLRNVMSSRGEHGTNLNELGNSLMSASYFARWSGPVSENQDNYYKNNYSYEGLYPVKHVQDMIFIQERTNKSIDILIKNTIMKYGAVAVSMVINDTDYKQAFDNNLKLLWASFNYNPNHRGSGHSVAIIGWDDNFDKTNFVYKPRGDGAFIVKDSNWECPVYVSYYDPYFANTSYSLAFKNVEEPDNYKNIYQYDYTLQGYYVPFNSKSAYISNRFTAKNNEFISAVGFYTYQDCKATVEIIVNNGNPYRETYDISSAGYHTVKTDNIQIKMGDTFEIRITLTSTSNNIKVPIDITNVAESYYSLNGIDWNHRNNGVFGIKAYTTGDSTNAVTSSNIISQSITKDYDKNTITLGLLKDKNGNFISNAVIEVIEYDNTFKKILSSYNLKSSSKGEIILPVFLNPNTYNFIVTFKGNNQYGKSNSYVLVKINKLSTQLVISDNCLVGENLKFTLKHGDTPLENKYLDVTKNGVYQRLTTNANGEAVIVLSNAITYSISIKFTDNIYESFDKYHNVKVSKHDITSNIKDDTSIKTITYKNGDAFKFNIGKPNIKTMLKINGKTYTRISDSNGDVSFNVGIKPGNYRSSTITIENDIYMCNKTVDLKINPLTITDKFNTDDWVTKYGGTDLVLKLSNKQGNGVAGIKVKYSFKNHGEKYKTTDSNGKITFKTSSLKPDSYQFWVKVSKKKFIFNHNGKERTLIVKKKK